MAEREFTRRAFLAAGGVLALAAVLPLGGCGTSTGGGHSGGVTVFALSARGRRESRASKRNAANKRFLTFAEADAGRAHAGDTCKVVTLVISLDQYHRLFANGNVVGDLRHLSPS